MVVRLHPAIRVIPPSSVIGDRWVAEHLLDKRRYNIPRTAAAALVAACRPQEPDELVKRLMECGGLQDSADFWERMVEDLRGRDFIVDAARLTTEPDIAWLVGLRERWTRAGWSEAAEYHLLSADYPCVDYSEAVGTVIDQNRMRSYQSREPDRDRFKDDYNDHPGTDLPTPHDVTGTGTVREVFSGTAKPRPATAQSVSALISMAFGATGERIPVTDSAPLLRTSSPSGGGRHPSEGYLVVRDVPGLDPGWHHITMKPFSLRLIGDVACDDVTLGRLFPHTFAEFPDVRAMVLLTSMFERNMYRYREPRTFRTVHMDAGHIAGTARLSALSLGLSARVCDRDDPIAVEHALSVNGMREGFLLTVAIGDGIEEA